MGDGKEALYYFFFLRDSDRAIAIACLGLFTIGPFLDPEWRAPSLNSSITFLIFFCACVFFFAMIIPYFSASFCNLYAGDVAGELPGESVGDIDFTRKGTGL
jgi:uncharacterized membrane protein